MRLTDGGELLLEILSSSGAILSSKPLKVATGELRIPIPIYCDRETTYLAIGSDLVALSPGDNMQTIEFDSPIKSIQGSARNTSSRIALSFDDGVQILWCDNRIVMGPKICLDMLQPQAIFTRSGRLVVAADDRCEVYNTVGQEAKFVGESTVEPCKRLMGCQQADLVALLIESGKICVYRIPVS